MKKLLGIVNKEIESCASGETIYLEKHRWECGWYWALGYIGNKNIHTHIEELIKNKETDVNKIFSKTKITQNTWWILRDLFIQAYTIKKCAEVYRYGGHQTNTNGLSVERDDKLIARLNSDLEKILNNIWELL